MGEVKLGRMCFIESLWHEIVWATCMSKISNNEALIVYQNTDCLEKKEEDINIPIEMYVQFNSIILLYQQ